MSITFEGQLSQQDGSWFLTMTLANDTSEWTSPPVIFAAETREEAIRIATAKLAAAKAALLGEPP